MSRADQLRAKAARLSATPPPAEPPAPAAGSSSQQSQPEAQQQPRPAASSSGVTRVKPVRMTLDLTPALHADFEDWTTHASRELGRGRVVRADVLRVLVRQLLDDPEAQERVKEALRQNAD